MLKLSLAEVARRAGTSAATLSRYENGWSRFEIYTLRKLASALDCDVTVGFRPRPARKQGRPEHGAVYRQIARLFWDHDLKPEDLEAYPRWVVERVIEYGSLADINVLRGAMGRREFLTAVASAERVSPRTRCFWRQILEMEGVPCTTRFSRNTAWNS